VNQCNMVPLDARLAALANAGHACQTCGIRAPCTDLHTHRGACGDVQALCRPCHHAAHRDPAGMVWEDAAEMAAYWEPFWCELERP